MACLTLLDLITLLPDILAVLVHMVTIVTGNLVIDIVFLVVEGGQAFGVFFVNPRIHGHGVSNLLGGINNGISA